MCMLVDLATHVDTGGNRKCGLIVKQTLVEKQLSWEHDRIGAGASVCSATKQIPTVSVKKSANDYSNAI